MRNGSLNRPSALAAAAATLLCGGSAMAASARMEGLAGDPATARNGMFVMDDLNVFLNPALAAYEGDDVRYRGRVPFSLGLAQSQGSVTLDPFGGALIPIGDNFTIGVFLNRRAGLFSDQAALNTVWGSLVDPASGAIVLPDGSTSGSTAATPFLPLDLIAAYGNDDVQIGFGLYASFARNRALDDAYDEDEDLVSATTTTTSTSYVTAAVGVRIAGDDVSPDFWVRYGGANALADQLVEMPQEDDEIVVDQTVSTSGPNGISLGARVPIEADDFLITPGVQFAYAAGMPKYVDRLDDNPLEDEFLYHVASVSATVGVGIEYAPNDEFRVVGTLSAEIDSTTLTTESGEDESYSRSVGRSTSVRAPIASIGAEGKVLKNLWLRGAIRAGLATSALLGSYTHENDNGIDQIASASLSGAAGNSLSAAGGFSLPFEKVVLDVTAGGLLVSQEQGGGFFSRADLTFIIPD
ncbi:hypothetical protein L6R50_11275 [Myxococcota bacterium]|nr:hypothetical protein [Myxococcota bacterium]